MESREKEQIVIVKSVASNHLGCAEWHLLSFQHFGTYGSLPREAPWCTSLRYGWSILQWLQPGLPRTPHPLRRSSWGLGMLTCPSKVSTVIHCWDSAGCAASKLSLLSWNFALGEKQAPQILCSLFCGEMHQVLKSVDTLPIDSQHSNSPLSETCIPIFPVMLSSVEGGILQKL